ncbi:hypothetical protein KIN20_022538 [Parelaphostrongylus tenuis]|uniref:Uncharacterized protein n=1 Tax=Parelaphostrongylus tenuis TaxID=148309 RepID=A0AAD5MUC6_PARTN|nr:hypothetical protein KIN20_022538 [Parelaphostrongylus tenuis]
MMDNDKRITPALYFVRDAAMSLCGEKALLFQLNLYPIEQKMELTVNRCVIDCIN